MSSLRCWCCSTRWSAFPSFPGEMQTSAPPSTPAAAPSGRRVAHDTPPKLPVTVIHQRILNWSPETVRSLITFLRSPKPANSLKIFSRPPKKVISQIPFPSSLKTTSQMKIFPSSSQGRQLSEDIPQFSQRSYPRTSKGWLEHLPLWRRYLLRKYDAEGIAWWKYSELYTILVNHFTVDSCVYVYNMYKYVFVCTYHQQINTWCDNV